jgi:hypothetical protein
MMTIKWLGIRLRQWVCPHEKRVREGVYRPQGSARRRERYSCPDCHLVWTEEAPHANRTGPPYTTPS